MIVVYDRSFIVLANGIMIINYDRKGFIVHSTGQKVDETLIINSRLKTGYLRFLRAIEALQLLFEDLVVNGPLTFALTHKISQDHIELSFAAVPSGLGASNNLSCKQFSSIVKRLLVLNNITSHTGMPKTWTQQHG